MDKFNNIPKTGTFGNAVDKINDNFQLAYVAIGDVEYATRKNKGLFPTLTALQAAVPSPTKGDWGIVGESFPADLYVCKTDGAWVHSGDTYEGDSLDLNDYVLKSTFNNAISPLQDMAEQWEDQKAQCDETAAEVDVLNRKIFGGSNKIWMTDTDWKTGGYNASGTYFSGDYVYTYYYIKNTKSFLCQGAIINYVNANKEFISNLTDNAAGGRPTGAVAADYPEGAVYLCSSIRTQYLSAGYCTVEYDEDILSKLEVEVTYPTLRNGSAGNASNEYCVSMNDMMTVQKGDIIKFDVLNKTLTNGQRLVYCGYGVFHHDYNERRTDNVFVAGATGSFNLGFTVYQPPTSSSGSGSYVAQRIGTNVSQGDIRVTHYKAGTLDCGVEHVSYPDAYERNRDKEARLAAAVRYNAEGNELRDLGLLIITDSHGDEQAENNAIAMAKGFKYVDALIHLGDFSASNATEHREGMFDTFCEMGKPFYFVVGNHDIGNSKTKSLCFTNAEAYDAFIAPIVAAGWLRTGEYTDGKCYYYHDFYEQKIRLICVYEFDDPNDENASDSTQYRILRGMSVISKAQATWFCDTLASTPSGYNVVVAMHGPFSDNATSKGYKFSQAEGVSAASASLRLYSTDFWAVAVDAFVNRKSMTFNMVCKGDASYLNVGGKYWTVTKDFSTAKGGFLCYLGGHRHRDYVFVHNTYKYQKQIDVTCAHTKGYLNPYGGDLMRSQTDGRAKDSLTFVGLDNTGNTARLVKLGVDLTKEMVARDYEEIPMDESTPVVVSDVLATHDASITGNSTAIAAIQEEMAQKVTYVHYWGADSPTNVAKDEYWFDTANLVLKKWTSRAWVNKDLVERMLYLDMEHRKIYVYYGGAMAAVGGNAISTIDTTSDAPVNSHAVKDYVDRKCSEVVCTQWGRAITNPTGDDAEGATVFCTLDGMVWVWTDGAWEKNAPRTDVTYVKVDSTGAREYYYYDDEVLEMMKVPMPETEIDEEDVTNERYPTSLAVKNYVDSALGGVYGELNDEDDGLIVRVTALESKHGLGEHSAATADDLGKCFFDTKLNKPLWGTSRTNSKGVLEYYWVDATGKEIS